MSTLVENNKGMERANNSLQTESTLVHNVLAIKTTQSEYQAMKSQMTQVRKAVEETLAEKEKSIEALLNLKLYSISVQGLLRTCPTCNTLLTQDNCTALGIQ